MALHIIRYIEEFVKLVVGLGNIGKMYGNTRHNVGFMVAEKLVEGKSFAKSKGAPLAYSWLSLGDEKIEVIKPTTFMNKSGEAAIGPLRKHKDLTTDDVYVVHDDLDISLGDWKLHKGKGPREHKGVMSIEKHLKTKDFWRVRVGVDNRSVERRIPGEKYVLQQLKKDERKVIDRVVEEIVEELKKRFVV